MKLKTSIGIFNIYKIYDKLIQKTHYKLLFPDNECVYCVNLNTVEYWILDYLYQEKYVLKNIIKKLKIIV